MSGFSPAPDLPIATHMSREPRLAGKVPVNHHNNYAFVASSTCYRAINGHLLHRPHSPWLSTISV